MVHLPILNSSSLSGVVPIVPGVVTLIVNTLQFLHSTHQSLSQSNILAIVLPLMLLRSGMNSLMVCAAQHQLPPLEKAQNLPVCKSLSTIASPVSPWYDMAMSLD